jgi:hypothetical protein
MPVYPGALKRIPILTFYNHPQKWLQAAGLLSEDEAKLRLRKLGNNWVTKLGLFYAAILLTTVQVNPWISLDRAAGLVALITQRSMVQAPCENWS